MSKDFANIVSLIQQSRARAYHAVNTELVNLYWQVGQYVSNQLAMAAWGDKTIEELADYIQRTEPQTRGFNKRGIYRMRQFYETYNKAAILGPAGQQPSGSLQAVAEIVSPLVTQLKKPKKAIVSPLVTQLKLTDIRQTELARISWTNHLIILSGTNSLQEKEFYIRLAATERYSKRQLQRQLAAGLFERAALGAVKRSTRLSALPEEITGTFKDNYVFEFLNLPEPHSENDLQKAIIKNLKQFLLEFSRDFAYLGEEFLVQVGNKDFAIDLLFFNRSLNCLVAIELKVVEFAPEHLAKLNFYLEALDRDVRKQHENPAIGILLCKAKDDEVVEYAMSRQLSPAMVAKYQLQLPDKKLLQARLHEFFELEQKETD